MSDVAGALGVSCTHCHERGDFEVVTHEKIIANWMATELIPSLSKREGGAVWCKDCHASEGRPRAKILGSPRRNEIAIEWMTVHLVDRFATAQGRPLFCKSCHVGKLGTPEFARHLLPGPPAAPSADVPPAMSPVAPSRVDRKAD